MISAWWLCLIVPAACFFGMMLAATISASLISAGASGLVIENNAGTLTAWPPGPRRAPQ